MSGEAPRSCLQRRSVPRLGTLQAIAVTHGWVARGDLLHVYDIYICIYVYIYICIYIYVYVYIYMCVCIQMSEYGMKGRRR